MTEPPAPRFLDRRSPPHIGSLVAISSVSALTMTIYLPSLPSMAEYFDAEYWVLQLSVSLYLVGNAVLQLVIGPLSDRYGRRPVLLSGFAIFIVASLGCALATSVEMFLLFRMIQSGVVTGMALGRAVIRDLHEADQSAAMIGYVTMGTSVMPMLGPTLGGVLDDTFGWQGSFWVLFAMGIAMLVLIYADLGETARGKGRSFRAQFAEYPELLTSPRFWGYTICAMMSAGLYFAYLGGAPFVAVTLFGLSPTGLGIGLGAPALGYFTGNFLSGRYSVALGINRMVLTGTVISVGGVLLQMASFWVGLGGPATFFGFMCVVTLGNGMTLPNAIAGTLSVRPLLAGSASGLGGAMQIAGGAAMAALAGVLLTVESGAAPLLWLMLIAAVGAALAVVYVIARSRSLRDPF